MTDAPLVLFNSLSRALERFVPIEPDRVRMYSCGPTVYDFAHLGNLRAYIFTDTLRRVLEYKGYSVEHVINITDVGHLTSDADVGEDKMELAAGKSGRTIWDVAAFYTAAFKADLAALNVRDPGRWSVATDHIAEMIAFAREIEANGAAYVLDGGLYFDVTRVPDYGRLARADTAGEEVVGRIAEVSGKRNPADFALWRRSPPGAQRLMEWDSPWGVGAPGWHLECSVMSIKYLGRQFDIHTGGIDHREIHHPNEIAQNQAYTCTPETGANFWMHNNFLVDRDGKMSKSKGGIATLQALVDRGVHPLAYRLLCLSAHYRSELEFSGEALLAALTRLKRMVMAVEKIQQNDFEALRFLIKERLSEGLTERQAYETGLPPTALLLLAQFEDAVSNDLLVPSALIAVERVLADQQLSIRERLQTIGSMDLVLGLNLLNLTRYDVRLTPVDSALPPAEIEAQLEERRTARALKDFATSDRLRDNLAAAGVEVMDGDPFGWEWAVRLD